MVHEEVTLHIWSDYISRFLVIHLINIWFGFRPFLNLNWTKVNLNQGSSLGFSQIP